jgi:hypothetical protein
MLSHYECSQVDQRLAWPTDRFDEDGGRDDDEKSYYGAATDPGFTHLEQARRRFRRQPRPPGQGLTARAIG